METKLDSRSTSFNCPPFAGPTNQPFAEHSVSAWRVPEDNDSTLSWLMNLQTFGEMWAPLVGVCRPEVLSLVRACSASDQSDVPGSTPQSVGCTWFLSWSMANLKEQLARQRRVPVTTEVYYDVSVSQSVRTSLNDSAYSLSLTASSWCSVDRRLSLKFTTSWQLR